MEEVAVSVNDIWFAEFVLNESHDMGQIRLAHVLSVEYRGHGPSLTWKERWSCETEQALGPVIDACIQRVPSRVNFTDARIQPFLERLLVPFSLSTTSSKMASISHLRAVILSSLNSGGDQDGYQEFFEELMAGKQQLINLYNIGPRSPQEQKEVESGMSAAHYHNAHTQ